MILSKLITKKPDLKVLIVVPTTNLKEQWSEQIDDLGYSLNCEIQVINTVVTRDWTVDLLILDEIHSFLSTTFAQVFVKVKYKLVLGLTATLERLDGRHEICQKYCPVCDSVPITECIVNGWVSLYKEYLVLIDVDDIDKYKEYTKEFTGHYEFFNFKYDVIQSCLGKEGFINKAKLRDAMCPNGSEEQRKAVFKAITFHSQRFMQLMQLRKSFINNHPKKIELTRKIIEARPNSKIITFSNNIKMAESIGMGGKVYSGKDTKKKGRMTMEEFKTLPTGVLHTLRKCDSGADIPNLSVGIIIGTDSSQIKSQQRLNTHNRAYLNLPNSGNEPL
jgi:superfamily II DNA or RNA helicase